MKRIVTKAKTNFTRVVVAVLCIVIAGILYFNSFEPVEVNMITSDSPVAGQTKAINKKVSNQSQKRKNKLSLDTPSNCWCAAAGVKQPSYYKDSGALSLLNNSMTSYNLLCYHRLGWKVKDEICTSFCEVNIVNNAPVTTCR